MTGKAKIAIVAGRRRRAWRRPSGPGSATGASRGRRRPSPRPKSSGGTSRWSPRPPAVLEPVQVVEVKSNASGEVLEVDADTGDRGGRGHAAGGDRPARRAERRRPGRGGHTSPPRCASPPRDAEQQRAERLFEAGPQLAPGCTSRPPTPRPLLERRWCAPRRTSSWRGRGAGTRRCGHRSPERCFKRGAAGADHRLGDLERRGRHGAVQGWRTWARCRCARWWTRPTSGRCSRDSRARSASKRTRAATFPGAVVKIEPQAVVQQNVTMFPVLIRLDNPRGAAPAGHERRGDVRGRAAARRGGGAEPRWCARAMCRAAAECWAWTSTRRPRRGAPAAASARRAARPTARAGAAPECEALRDGAAAGGAGGAEATGRRGRGRAAWRGSAARRRPGRRPARSSSCRPRGARSRGACRSASATTTSPRSSRGLEPGEQGNAHLGGADPAAEGAAAPIRCARRHERAVGRRRSRGGGGACGGRS